MADESPEKREHQRQGKIARLPETIRAICNQRILDGWTGRRICEWLNSLGDVRTLLGQEFGGEPVSEANLSRWRKGGYQDWLAEREKVARLRSLAEYCGALADAGDNKLFAGASNILGGQILDLLERANAEDALGLAKAIVALRGNEIESTKLELARVKSEQAERALQLSEQKFRRETCALFLKWVEDERAKRIVDGAEPKDAKLEQLAELFWADAPEQVGPVVKGGAA